MAALHAYGCSLTYGESLADIHPLNSKPSRHAWPQRVANSLGVECVNHSRCGTSPAHHWYTVHQTAHTVQQGDLVVIYWSTPDRWHIFDGQGAGSRIGVWNQDKWTKNYYKHYSSEANSRELFWTYYYSANQLCGMHKVVNIMSLQEIESVPDWCKLHNTLAAENLWGVSKRGLPYGSTRDTAEDGVHPGIASHHKFAQRLLEHVQCAEL